ncbi:MAG: xylulokinase [Oscillospiraceae bacterium]|nr:xylulokinase [Oscillospiraceae bacterium]
MKYAIGVDIGTSGTKSVLFDEKGTVIASASQEYPLYQEKNGYAEQEPSDWYNASINTIKKIISESGVSADDICGVGISGQMHGLVMLDENNEVIRKSIIWCDQRTAKECEEITEKVGKERLIEITANPALTGFTASKILWVRNNEPDNYKKCRHILLPKDYVRFMLTGEYATDVSDASGMQLLDVPNRCWSDEVLEKLDIDKSLLAKVYESCEITGNITSKAAELTGLKEGTPVVGGAGDNAAAAVGTGIVSDGKAFTTIGTSGVVFAHTSEIQIDPKGRVHTFCCAVPGCWHIMGVTQAACLSLKWFRDNFCDTEVKEANEKGVSEYFIMDNEAEKIAIGSDKLLYLPYLMGERTPHLDPDIRGTFFGISAMHTRAHFIRAVMEGVAYSLRDCKNIISEMGTEISDMMACGGGGTSPLWRSMLADLYDCPVKTVSCKEGPALGVAILAFVGTGVYDTVEQACDAMIKTDKVQEPDADASAQYEKYYQLYRKIYYSIKEDCKELAML